MLIGGLQKTSLIDFPQTIACTVFTVGCNFRCPFCHNKDLVTLANFKQSKISKISQKYFFDFLIKRQKFLDGVCITGGEPTIYPDLPQFIKRIKKLGYKVKLDTNGTNPKMLDKLYQDNLLDYVAMDVKNDFKHYRQAIGISTQLVDIRQSIALILQSGIDFDFRTTVVPGIHNQANITQLAVDLSKIAREQSLDPAKIKYFIQKFRPQNCFDSKYLQTKPFSEEKIKCMLNKVKKYLTNTKIRGEE